MSENPRMLVVDDDQSHRIMLRAVLKKDGHRVTEAADGTEAVRAVEKEPFDIILLDIRMTTMDGIEALSEIRKISPLVPVLQEKEFEPLWSARTIKVDIRVIAATNKDLTKEVKEGRFREDLYYRLNVVPVTMPPLRERKEDISHLTDHFLAIFREKNRRPIKGISGKALDLLVRYDWPGNTRELKNCIERAVIMAKEGMITPVDFSPQIQKLSGEEEKGGFAIPSGISLEAMERELIVKTLAETGGNRTRASEILGINRRTIQNKLREYELNSPASGPA